MVMVVPHGDGFFIVRYGFYLFFKGDLVRAFNISAPVMEMTVH